MRRATLAIALLAALAAPAQAGAQASACENADSLPGDVRAEQLAEAVICLVNEERASRGLVSLRTHQSLELVALRHALDMEERNYFSHRSWSGRRLAQRVDLTRYLPWDGDWRLGENLRWGTGVQASPRAAVAGWLDSESHRRNMLTSSFRDAGVGMAQGAPIAGYDDTRAATYALELGYRD